MCRHIVLFFFLFVVQGSLSQPFEHNINEGRGIGSTIWGWLTYPFSWWGASNDVLPVSDQLVQSTTHKPFDTIEIGKYNVTIWCNDQLCTTRRCGKFGCYNITCSIYDTDMTGECREYNMIIKPEEPTTQKPTEIVVKPTEQDEQINTEKPLQSTTATPTTSTETITNQAVDERPLELEAVLSSTVTETSNQAQSKAQ